MALGEYSCSLRLNYMAKEWKEFVTWAMVVGPLSGALLGLIVGNELFDSPLPGAGVGAVVGFISGIAVAQRRGSH